MSFAFEKQTSQLQSSVPVQCLEYKINMEKFRERSFLKPCMFCHSRKFPLKILVIISRDIVGLEDFVRLSANHSQTYDV